MLGKVAKLASWVVCLRMSFYPILTSWYLQRVLLLRGSTTRGLCVQVQNVYLASRCILDDKYCIVTRTSP